MRLVDETDSEAIVHLQADTARYRKRETFFGSGRCQQLHDPPHEGDPGIFLNWNGTLSWVSPGRFFFTESI